MLKVFLLSLVIFLQVNLASAQREILDVSKREPEQEKMERPAYMSVKRDDPQPLTPDDFSIEIPGESAVYLANNGYSKVYYDYSIPGWRASTKKTMRIKILSPAGLDMGTVKIPVFLTGDKKDRRERIREIKAVTYNLNDQTGEIDSSVLEPREISRADILENVEEVSFALPNVQVNSIIDISYIIDSQSLSRLDDWYFQKNHPVKKSWFTMVIDGPYNYAYALQGQERLKGALTNDVRGIAPLGRLRPMEEEWWYVEDIPAYKEEPFTASREDNIAKLSFQFESAGEGKDKRTFLKSWDDVTRDLQESKRFKQFYIGQKSFYSKTESVPSLALARLEYEAFKKRFKWDGRYGVYPNVTFRELMGRMGEGNTSSLGLALYRTLKQSGYDVKAVLLSPRFNGKINYSYPFVDHLIATIVRLNIGGKTYLLDPINNEVPFGQLGKDLLNGKGLILGDSAAWQNLTIDAEDYKTSQTSVSVTEDEVTVDVQLTMKNYGTISTESPKDLFKTDWEVSEIEIQKNELTSQQLTASIEQEIEDDLIIIPLTFDKIVFSENPFNDNERLYPIDFLHKKKYGYKLEVKLSDEYEFDAIPASQIVKTSDGKLSAVLNVNQLGQNLNLTFLFWTKTNSFEVAYYPHLQSAYQLMAELAEGSIIVRRKP